MSSRSQAALRACLFGPMVGLTTAACGSATHSSAASVPNANVTAAGADTVPCTAAVRGVDVSTWRTVTARGFTLCVPPGWTGRGATRRQGASTLSWGTGNAPREPIAVRVAVVSKGERMPPPELPPNSDVRRFNEDIGGRTASLYRNRFELTYYVGAQWDGPSVWVTAQTPNADVADQVLDIARTVRFSYR